MSRRRGPRALACFLRGLRLSLSKPYLAVALWLIQLLLAAALILPISNTLHALLDHSPAADRMVANPDYGWWETVRREHPDLLGNFPEIATGLLSVDGIRWSELSGLRGVGATAFSLALLATCCTPSASAECSGPCGSRSSSLVTFGREGMRQDAGLPPLHVRRVRRRVRRIRVDLCRLGRRAPGPGAGASHRAGRAGRHGASARRAPARPRRDQAPRRRRAHGLGGAARPAARVALLLRHRGGLRAAAAPLRDPGDVRARHRGASTWSGWCSIRRRAARRASRWCRSSSPSRSSSSCGC